MLSPSSDSTIFLKVETSNGLQLSVRDSNSFAVVKSKMSVRVDSN